MHYSIKIIKSIEEAGLMIKGVDEATENEAKYQKSGFLGMLLGSLNASLSGNLLTGKQGVIKANEDTIRAVEGTIRAGQDF